MSGELPTTGFALTVLGVTFGLNWIIGLAVLVIVASVVVLRLATRHQRA